MIRLRFFYTLLVFQFCIAANGQILYPGLDGVQLQDALRADYRPSSILTLSQAKDTLYTLIDNVQDSVEGIYSGLKLFLPENVDASEWLFMNGNGINLEHVYPQSKGADEGQAGHSDMHHLYPSRVAVNSARASFPFSNIPDPMTTTWFRKNTSMQNIPSSNIDSYSESINGAFEPRESVKGNIARSVFYFYTMYQDDADAADPNFFPAQRPTLCEWHLADIVDDSELMRSAMVAQYQDGKENPFVLDCTAALRAWCPEYEGCTTSITISNGQDGVFQLSAYAIEGHIIVNIISEQADNIRISIYDISGRMLNAEQLTVTEGATAYSPQVQFVPGMYIISSITDSGNSQMHITRCTVR